MPGIWAPNGDWIEFAQVDHRSLTAEMATAAAVGEDLGSMLAYLPDPDPVLRKRGDDAKILEDLTADDQVMTAIQNRKLRVLCRRDYDFRPGVLPGKEATPQATALCEALTKDLETIGLRDVFAEILDTPFYGHTICELIWAADGGRMRLKNIIPKPRQWFAWDKDRRPCLRPKTGLDPRPLPWGKFIVVRHFPTYQNPYGLRLLSRCLWPVAFKRGGVKFYTRFLDKYGQPWVLGRAPRGANLDAKRAMAGDLAAMVQDAVAVIPADAAVDLVESKGRAGDQFEAYLKRWDKAIFKVIMGQTLTSEMDGQGSRAASETHYGVAEDMAEADQYIIESAMNELALLYREINAPAAEAPVFGFNEPEDYGAQADLDAKLHGVGVRFTRAHIERRFGLQPDEFILDGEKEAAADGDEAAFAEPGPDHQDALDALVAAILPESVKRNAKFIERLVALLNKAQSFDEIALLLAEHLGQDADMREQEDLLADLLTAAALMGRAAVRDEPDAA